MWIPQDNLRITTLRDESGDKIAKMKLKLQKKPKIFPETNTK
jgi:hypothetical protein